MKVSNIILTAAGLLILALLILINMALKAEYGKEDYKGRFYRHETKTLEETTNISISVPGYLRICLESAPKNELKYPGGWDEYIEVITRGDSLKLQVKENLPHGADTLYILLKELSSVNMNDRGRLKISGFHQAGLHLTAEKNSYIELENTALDSLTIRGGDNSEMITKKNNKIRFLDLFLEGQAVFKAGDLEFSGLKTRVGPQSKVEFTGRSLTSFIERSTF